MSSELKLSKGVAARSSNLELFRIISMLLIVAHHYVVNSGLMASDGPVFADPMSWRSMFLVLFGAFGKVGINCFVLITGYFMCKSRITAKKFCKLLLEIEFYAVIIWLIFILTGYETFSFMGFVKMISPVKSLSDDFTSCYLIFFLLIPFLNILIGHMSEKQHIKLLVLCLFAYVILGTVPKFRTSLNYVSWFCVIYFIGSYVRLYDKKLFRNTSFWGISTLIVLLVSLASVVGMVWIGESAYYFVADSNKFFAVVLAFSAFMFFKNLKIKNSRFVNGVAASAFGVLLIHANSDTMRQWLWRDTLNNVGMYGSDFLVLHALGCVIAVFAVCTVIDRLRILLLEKPFFRIWDKCFDRVQKRYIKFENKLCEIFKIQG